MYIKWKHPFMISIAGFKYNRKPHQKNTEQNENQLIIFNIKNC